ncbi:MAG: ThuA domain-containing protein [Acidobacteria bacterium]|nr:ThuA domain-containing protein [Acidobacteriota bacterium]
MMSRHSIGVSLVGLTLFTLGSAHMMRAPVQGQDTGVRKRVLVLTHNAFYKHDMLETLEHTVAELGERGGFEVTSLEGYKQDQDNLDLSMISAAYLSRFDGLLLATNGELPLDDGQRQALVDFVRNGKGLVAVHNAPVTLYTYPSFGEMVGGYFWKTFNALAQDQRRIVLNVEDRTHPATRMLEPSWELLDEYYQMAPEAWDAGRPDLYVGPTGHGAPIGFSRDRVQVLISLDTNATDMSGRPPEWERGGDYPQAWYQQFGQGRSLYTSLGHRDELWTGNTLFRAHIRGAIRWSLGLED